MADPNEATPKPDEPEKPALVEAPPLGLPADDPVVEEEPVKDRPPPPRILEVTPDHGPITGKTGIVITGVGFVLGCTVSIDDVEIPASFGAEGSLRVETPEHVAGHVDLRVTNPDWQSELRVRAFLFDAPPTLARVEPACVSVRGGIEIVIHGSGFVPGCSVRLGDEGLYVTWLDATRLGADSPPHFPGEVALTVENPDGQSGALAHALRFAPPPVITEITPAIGSIRGGDEIVIEGRDLELDCVVRLGGELASVEKNDSEKRLRVITPPSAKVGPVDVHVQNPTGVQQVLLKGFTYRAPAPRLREVGPASGPSAGGTLLILRGVDFHPRCEVLVCGLRAPAVFRDAGELEVITPAVPRDGLVDVRVINPDEQAHTLERCFRYQAPLPPPRITAVSPGKGPQAGGTKVAILGEDLAEGAAVSFGGAPAQVKFLTHKQMEAIAPPCARAGNVDVEVVNPDGVTARLEDAFVYEAKPGPTITSVRPTNGPSTGGTKLVIEGENFAKESLVYVGREPPKDLVVKSATEIHVVTAARKTAGVVDVEVTLPDAPRAVLKNGFRYDATLAPVIRGVSPAVGGTGGGTEITITGQNFLKETLVLVDGKPTKGVKLVDKSTLEAKVPPGAAGKMVDVTVRNPDGKEAVQKRAFLYDPRYG